MGKMKSMLMRKQEEAEPMSAFDSYSDEEMVNGVLAWAEDHPDFDSSFIESLSESVEKRGELSEKQRDAVENIAAKWKIDIGEYV